MGDHCAWVVRRSDVNQIVNGQITTGRRGRHLRFRCGAQAQAKRLSNVWLIHLIRKAPNLTAYGNLH